MSVRVCYVRRGDRGHSIRELRLVGQTTDQTYPAAPANNAEPPAPVTAEAGGAWLKQELSATRASGALTFLCLDVEGAACSWLTAPNTEPAVVAALARLGSSDSADGGGQRVGAAIGFFAPSPLDSSIQAITSNGHAARTRGLFPARKKPAEGEDESHPSRLPVLALTDVPARLLIDALDRLGVAVESTASIWHALAIAWDPSWTSGPAGDPLAAAAGAQTGAVIVVDPAGRLIWSWSRAGKLVVCGSMRVRLAQPAGSAGEPAAPETPMFGREEVGRLTTEWLSWAAQVGAAPTRITCILPEGDAAGASEFGQALGKAWPGVAIDAALYADPIGVTLRRVAERLEQTPATAAPASATALLGLTQRRGRQHRALYVWSALAIVALAAALGLWAWQLSNHAADTKSAAGGIEGQWRTLVKQHFPDTGPTIGKTDPEREIEIETDRLNKIIRPAVRTEPTRPIMEELETLSMVLGNSGLALENVELTSQRARVVVVCENVQDAADLLEALRSVSGSHLGSWTETYAPVPNSPSKQRMTYVSEWAKPVKPH